ncbi:MAG: TetR family transcriptional regulator [candidate division Zixibacteria bacterium]|nr:TetR family transcriptional regulator [candidate division Zixibacteria bacterium]
MERLKPNDRKQQIVDAAVELAVLKGGYRNITRDNVALIANCSRGLINYHFDTIEELRGEVIKRAIALAIPNLIAEAILDKSPLVSNISEDLRAKAANSILSKKD